jgi:hypothetical protein
MQTVLYLLLQVAAGGAASRIQCLPSVVMLVRRAPPLVLAERGLSLLQRVAVAEQAQLHPACPALEALTPVSVACRARAWQVPLCQVSAAWESLACVPPSQQTPAAPVLPSTMPRAEMETRAQIRQEQRLSVVEGVVDFTGAQAAPQQAPATPVRAAAAHPTSRRRYSAVSWPAPRQPQA